MAGGKSLLSEYEPVLWGRFQDSNDVEKCCGIWTWCHGMEHLIWFHLL